jgi:hypothetical protein
MWLLLVGLAIADDSTPKWDVTTHFPQPRPAEEAEDVALPNELPPAATKPRAAAQAVGGAFAGAGALVVLFYVVVGTSQAIEP